MNRLFALLLAAAAPGALACSGSLHVELAEAGVYALDATTVAAKQPGLAGCASADLVLTQRGQEVPIRLTGEHDGRFDGSDRIEWVGQPLHGPQSWFDAYSTVNVYVLSAKPGVHARIADVAATGNGAAPLMRLRHVEEDNLMIRLNQSRMKPWEEPDYWHWAKLTHVDPEPFAYDFDLSDLTRGSATATFTFRGMSDVPKHGKVEKPADHRVEVRLNDHALGAFEWDGRDEVAQTLTLPASLLRAEGNRLTLAAPARHAPWDAKNAIVDVVMFNHVELVYPIAGNLDVGKNDEPLRAVATGTITLTHAGTAPVLYADGRRLVARAMGEGRWSFAASAGVDLYPVIDEIFRAPSAVRPVAGVDWRTPAQSYDYLVVAHPRLTDAVKPLVDFHRDRGLKVALIDVNDVYDQFNDGIAHPQAIRHLVDRAWHDWPAPKPRFLLLVGDASFDIRHHAIDPSKLAKWADRELLAPGRFGDIPSTPYANTPADLPNRNLIPTWQFPSYDGQSASDNHFASVGKSAMAPVLAVGRFPVVEPAEVSAIVDKTINYLRTPTLGAWRRDVMFITDESDYFKTTSDQIAAGLDAEGFVADKVYASADEKDNLAHQTAIKDGLNDGRLLVHFIGHGGRYIWRTGPPDLRKNHDLFTLEDVSGLSNGAKLPLVLSMTCYSAPFDNPTEDSIGERFLREAGKGAIAVFAASWRNTPSPDFSKAIIDQLLKPGVTVGEAIVAAKAKNNDPTLVETYNLLGDPALVLERPDGGLRFARRAGWLGGERIEVQLDQPTFSGKVTADWLDANGKVLARDSFAALGNRFVVPTPAAAKEATELHVYAADAARAFDAIGRLVLIEPPPPAPKLAAPKPAPLPAAQPAPTPVAAASEPPHAKGPDQIMRGGFDVSTKVTATRDIQSRGETSTGAPAQSSRSALRK